MTCLRHNCDGFEHKMSTLIENSEIACDLRRAVSIIVKFPSESSSRPRIPWRSARSSTISAPFCCTQLWWVIFWAESDGFQWNSREYGAETQIPSIEKNLIFSGYYPEHCNDRRWIDRCFFIRMDGIFRGRSTDLSDSILHVLKYSNWRFSLCDDWKYFDSFHFCR